MTYKAYIDNIRAKTGQGPEHYLEQARKLGLTKHSDLLRWLKTECGLGHGHANAMILYIQDPALAKRKIAADAKRAKGGPRGRAPHSES
jgi:Domain of unknown function (DUF4287)